MNYSKRIIEALLELEKGGTVYSGRLGTLSDTLYAHGLFSVIEKGCRTYYKAKNVEVFKADLASMDETFRDLDALLSLFKDPANLSRGDMASYNGNSKIKRKRTFNGFLINTYQPISTTLQGKPYVVNPVEGTFTFVYDWRHFSIPDNIIIVGIENPENYEDIRKQRHLFEDAVGKITGMRTSPILFVSRYPQENSSADLRRWLMSVPNKYIHYGDFDLKGIDIFHTEYYKHLGGRASFLIPDDIETFIKGGIRERYDSQYEYRNITSPIPEIQSLIDMINKYKRCFDQEGLEEYD